MKKETNTYNPGWNFENSYQRLPEKFFRRLQPVAVKNPEILLYNTPLAHELGLGVEPGPYKHLALVLGGNALPEGSKPIAQAYAGHQFGHFTMLGDGRAILLGEQITPNGQRMDIQLKGSGQTPFSRRGDGRATLYSMLREYIISEAIHLLGIPTTRSLAVVTTGEEVQREFTHHGAVLTRVSTSHLRVNGANLKN